MRFSILPPKILYTKPIIPLKMAMCCCESRNRQSLCLFVFLPVFAWPTGFFDVQLPLLPLPLAEILSVPQSVPSRRRQPPPPVAPQPLPRTPPRTQPTVLEQLMGGKHEETGRIAALFRCRRRPKTKHWPLLFVVAGRASQQRHRNSGMTQPANPQPASAHQRHAPAANKQKIRGQICLCRNYRPRFAGIAGTGASSSTAPNQRRH